MIAVPPNIPDSQQVVFAKDQEQYVPLPAAIIQRTEGQAVLTRWRLSEEERAAIASGADLFLELLTFGQPLQPIRIYVDEPPEAN